MVDMCALQICIIIITINQYKVMGVCLKYNNNNNDNIYIALNTGVSKCLNLKLQKDESLREI